MIVAVKFWGQHWSGKRISIFCDNDSVVDVVTYMKPKDPQMQAYLREFLYWVCKFNFHPILSKISSSENDIADFLSRNWNELDAETFFKNENLPVPDRIHVCDDDYCFIADW